MVQSSRTHLPLYYQRFDIWLCEENHNCHLHISPALLAHADSLCVNVTGASRSTPVLALVVSGRPRGGGPPEEGPAAVA